MRLNPILAVPIALTLTSALPLAGQREEGLDRTMRRFAQALRGEDAIAAYFPRRGDWTWELTVRRRTGVSRGVWRFPAIPRDSDAWLPQPTCGSWGGIEWGRWGALRNYGERRWRRVRGNRFVPRGASAASPVFVQWRREGRAWVVDAYGDQRDERNLPYTGGLRVDSILGAPLLLPVPAGTDVAEGTEWFDGNWPLSAWPGSPYLKYGVPRVFQPGDVVRLGAYRGVPVYADPKDVRQPGLPEVIYVLANTAGALQPFMGGYGAECR